MRTLLFSLAAVVLLASCQKEHSFDEAVNNLPTAAPTAIYQSACDTTRVQLAKGIASCMQSLSFQRGLAEGLSLMRDGDNEVLLAEIFQSPRTRGGARWNSEVASQLAGQLGLARVKTRGSSQTYSIESMLEKDPLLQVLYVPANDDYSRNEVNLSADNLKIVVVPADYDDRSSEKLMAFDRWGHQIEYDPRDEQSPLVVVGRNERLEYIKGAASQDAEVYMKVDNGYYRDRLIYREIEKPDDPGFGRGLLPVEPSLPNLKSAPVKREILKTSENIAQARFTSTKAMRRYEARVLGKPEVQYNAQMVGLTSGTIAGKEWKDGAWVSINSEIGYWSPLHKALVDCYTIEWVEIDNLGHSIELNVTSIVGGVALTGRVSLTYGDDRIGSQCIYFESEIDNLGYRTYSLGDTFQFSIRVKQKSE